jgi:hypothetical protein
MNENVHFSKLYINTFMVQWRINCTHSRVASIAISARFYNAARFLATVSQAHCTYSQGIRTASVRMADKSRYKQDIAVLSVWLKMRIEKGTPFCDVRVGRLALVLRTNWRSVCRVLRCDLHYHPFRTQTVQELF